MRLVSCTYRIFCCGASELSIISGRQVCTRYWLAFLAGLGWERVFLIRTYIRVHTCVYVICTDYLYVLVCRTLARPTSKTRPAPGPFFWVHFFFCEIKDYIHVSYRYSEHSGRRRILLSLDVMPCSRLLVYLGR